MYSDIPAESNNFCANAFVYIYEIHHWGTYVQSTKSPHPVSLELAQRDSQKGMFALEQLCKESILTVLGC